MSHSMSLRARSSQGAGSGESSLKGLDSVKKHPGGCAASIDLAPPRPAPSLLQDVLDKSLLNRSEGGSASQSSPGQACLSVEPRAGLGRSASRSSRQRASASQSSSSTSVTSTILASSCSSAPAADSVALGELLGAAAGILVVLAWPPAATGEAEAGVGAAPLAVPSAHPAWLASSADGTKCSRI